MDLVTLWGDDGWVLRWPSVTIDYLRPGIDRLARAMTETMYANHGVGLAAPQVGVPARVIVVDGLGEPIVFVNPEIIDSEGVATADEGCLSLPGLTRRVERAERIRLCADDEHWQPFEFKARGGLARAIQHEMDHLDGVLITDVGDVA